MSEFDFDELDKAVAGAINDDSSAPVASAPQISTHNTETLSNVSASSAPSSAPASTPNTPPASRRTSGRFMDVVHPSSDMRTRPSFTPPSPTSTNTPEVKNNTSLEEALEKEKDEIQWDMPLESPFLPDTKVEKRPLGGSGSPASNALLDTSVEELLLEAPEEELLLEATTMPDPIDFAAHASALPSENEDTGSDTPVFDFATEEVPEREITSIAELETTPDIESTPDIQPVAELEIPELEVVETATDIEPKEESKPVVEELEPIGPISITQQYKEQPATEQTSGAIYDTETYHQPISVATKKRSGAWIILWILLLIILGAGAGVAFYLFVLPQL